MEIYIIDKPFFTREKCECEKEAGFIITLNGTKAELCAECLGDIAKNIISALL